MKFSTVSCLLSTAAGALAASAGHVFLLDPSSSSSSHSATHHDTLDSETAQLIFAQRLGLSSRYDLPTDEKTLSRLNAFGGRPQHLLRGNRHQDDPSRILVVIEDVDDAMEVMPISEDAAFFDISPAPHPEQTLLLVDGFLEQLGRSSEGHHVNARKQDLGQVGSSVDFATGQRLMHIKSIESIVDNYGRSSPEYKSHIAEIRSTLQSLIASVDSSEDSLTIVMMPPASESAKRTEKAYRLVARAPNAARQPIEAPLSEAVSHVVSTVQSTTANQFSSLNSNNNNSTPLIKGPIRPYFTSKAACERTTNNCTGHGSCVVLFKDLEQEDEKKQDVFGCACKPQVVKNSNGRNKTTRYAGAACSKKDVSQEFWLLAGTTIFLLFIVGFGMSMLYSMGNEELPSVIGAGVSGPRATK